MTFVSYSFTGYEGSGFGNAYVTFDIKNKNDVIYIQSVLQEQNHAKSLTILNFVKLEE